MITTTVIIPVYNEIDFIEKTLNSLIQNDYPKENLEILILDGKSTDGTKEFLDEYVKKYTFIKVITNEKKLQVYGVNQGFNLAQGEYIIRCDAHAYYPKNYISTLVHFLEKSEDNVGNVGAQAIASSGNNTSIAQAISLILKHPFGVGISHRSVSINKPIDVDTVLFGAWKKKVLEKVGPFDINFVRGQDYEHNKRLITFGYRILLLNNLTFQYFTRTKITKLSKMIFQYAYAKAQIIKKYKELPSTRILIPILFLLGLFLLPFFKSLIYIYIIYLIIITYSIFKIKEKWNIKIHLFYLFPLIHISHGYGFLRGLIEQFLLGKSRINWKSTR